ncbi:SDR family oxidoreductase [Microcoleus sp. N9_B4]|uniref:SDR family oxidoreductase n=1 Tax=Microcoleus sp. N9_B4 TaxID=3055386 RepID=UPI002FD4E18C
MRPHLNRNHRYNSAFLSITWICLLAPKRLTDCLWCSFLMQEYGEADIVRDIPIGKIAPPQDVANVIAFLASGLATHATGTTIDINGASYVH